MGGVGALFDAFGEGGDIVAPWAKAGTVATSVSNDVVAAMRVVRNVVCILRPIYCEECRSERQQIRYFIVVYKKTYNIERSSS